ncbi:OsmC family protein [Candidatus Oscillochloris fontis]|uniref:OsmC family protein n=1 Tax=Candidatus Oscillochloris fontis TaxID=2496868 RepID=UPI00101CF30E|nr:OsmC family protein [Candidatus Oscillochloris fontis]
MGSITTRLVDDMLFESQMGQHSIRIDVPAAMGGSDRGPTPPEVFVASLGSCIAAFVAQYCNRVGIDASGLEVVITFDKADNPTRLINLRSVVNLPHGEFGAREEALHRVAEHCPVHETIATLGDVMFEFHDATTLNPA